MAAANPLVSTVKSPDSVPAILHPLALLAISDHITRHTLRKQPGPVAGGLLGQQSGRKVTIEYTFDFSVTATADGVAQIDAVWLTARLEQMRAVHKDPQLELVGWYTVVNRDGPTPQMLQVHEQILPLCGESNSAVLLAFHPEDLASQSVGGRLPLTIYETTYEGGSDAAAASPQDAGKATEDSSDREMTDAGAEAEAAASSAHAGEASALHMSTKLREIAYTVEMGEAEMISIDFVAGGVANASATNQNLAAASGSGSAPAGSSAAPVTSTAPASGSSASKSRDKAVVIKSDNQSKRRIVISEDKDEAPSTSTAAASSTVTPAPDSNGLTREDEELIATLTTRANAIRMLNARLQLLTKYLESVEATEAGGGGAAADAHDADHPPASLSVLRSIQALAQRLPLVVPPPVGGAFEEERLRQTNDVELVSLLLDDLMQGISAVRQVGTKFNIVEQAQAPARSQRLQGAGIGNGTGGGNGSSGLAMDLGSSSGHGASSSAGMLM